MISKLQKMRKKAELAPSHGVRMRFSVIANPEQANLASMLSSQ